LPAVSRATNGQEIAMQTLLISIVLSAAAFGADPVAKEGTSLDAAVESYERLATVIIEVRRTEDSVVKTILAHHYQAARDALQAAQSGREVQKHLEAAAAEVTYIANEGDKRVQAIRQRLAKAGHTHISDVDTKEDYLFVNSKEKKALLDAAKSIAQLGNKATPDQVAAASKNLTELFQKAIAPE
jgi:hypothetical protein